VVDRRGALRQHPNRSYGKLTIRLGGRSTEHRCVSHGYSSILRFCHHVDKDVPDGDNVLRGMVVGAVYLVLTVI
jgi:hypothetical protein